MSLPRYIINFEEIVSSLLPKENDKLENAEIGYQRSKGLRLIVGDKGKYQTLWRPSTDILITGINIAFSEEPHRFRDTLDIYIDDDLVFQNISLKDIYQYKNFRVFRRLRKDLEVRFVYHNNNRVAKDVWFEIDYIGDPLLAPIAIKCIDIDTNEELKTETHEISLGTHVLSAPQIDGYRLESEDKYYQIVLINRDSLENETEIVFNYKKKK